MSPDHQSCLLPPQNQIIISSMQFFFGHFTESFECNCIRFTSHHHNHLHLTSTEWVDECLTSNLQVDCTVMLDLLSSLVTIQDCALVNTNGWFRRFRYYTHRPKDWLFSVQQVKVSVLQGKSLSITMPTIYSKWCFLILLRVNTSKSISLSGAIYRGFDPLYLGEKQHCNIYRLRSKSFMIRIWSVFNASENPA